MQPELAERTWNTNSTMKTLQKSFPILSFTLMLLTGCGGSSDELANLKAENEKLKAENKQLLASLERAKNSSATTPATSSSSTSSTATSTDSATESSNAASDQATTYADISGAFGEKEIQDLINVGVFKVDSPNFEPSKPVTRGEFCKWLVESNNIIRPKKYYIRTADPGSPSSFTDMTDANPYFKYVQGLADAGWSVGFPDKTFRPNAVLTREQMIGIKNPIDWNSEQYSGYEKQWSDGNKINPHFLKQMSTEAFAYYQCKHQNNWARLYGATKVCQPQKPVSRAEAAACVWSIGRNPEHGFSAAKGKATE
ncbi:MAG: S-layer homology domain-containing protein [Candidatus Obscuribacterales bacterium]|jgi:hypothetical protein|nr:S-layer homology domain-containing protein [Candidatus Obscuribacterales bacterium]